MQSKLTRFLFAPCCLLILLPACGEQGEVTRISLERTRCFGVCPVYTVTIHADGLVEFHGEMFVESVGDYTARIDPQAFRRLRDMSERIDFFSLDTEYRFGTGPDGTRIVVSDLPTRITTLHRGRESKSVVNYFGGPAELEEFEKLIDEMGDTARWVGSPRPGF